MTALNHVSNTWKMDYGWVTLTVTSPDPLPAAAYEILAVAMAQVGDMATQIEMANREKS